MAWNCSRAICLWLFSYNIFLNIYQNCLQKNASTAMHVQKAAFLVYMYLLNTSQYYFSFYEELKERIKLHRPVEQLGIWGWLGGGESAPGMGWRCPSGTAALGNVASSDIPITFPDELFLLKILRKLSLHMFKQLLQFTYIIFKSFLNRNLLY